tara:strand:+ start:1870 stop:2373 length:504 start_codon:yes stop_codon:yes gene_type:complete
MGTDTLEQFTLFDMEEEYLLKEGEDVQECRICKKIKPLKSFHIKTSLTHNTGILDRSCNECERKASKERRERRKNMVEPPDDYRCPKCKRNQEEILNHTVVVDKITHERVERRKKVWVVDHDHDTGKIRGIICNPCNVQLGAFKDSIEELEEAIKYLRGDFDGSTGV